MEYKIPKSSSIYPTQVGEVRPNAQYRLRDYSEKTGKADSKEIYEFSGINFGYSGRLLVVHDNKGTLVERITGEKIDSGNVVYETEPVRDIYAGQLQHKVLDRLRL